MEGRTCLSHSQLDLHPLKAFHVSVHTALYPFIHPHSKHTTVLKTSKGSLNLENDFNSLNWLAVRKPNLLWSCIHCYFLDFLDLGDFYSSLSKCHGDIKISTVVCGFTLLPPLTALKTLYYSLPSWIKCQKNPTVGFSQCSNRPSGREVRYLA